MITLGIQNFPLGSSTAEKTRTIAKTAAIVLIGIPVCVVGAILIGVTIGYAAGGSSK